MDDLLTVRQVQELLQVDRITVYRMLKDGRLTGVKIGQQWRFSRQEVQVFLSGNRTPSAPADFTTAPQALPLHCVELIQNVFADIAEVGSITTDPRGEPLTELSNSCTFCNLIVASPQGRDACIASWRRLADQPEQHPRFATCHAGLQYACARIELNSHLEAMLIAGQFYAAPPDPQEEAERIRRLAEKYGIDPQALLQAACDLTVIDERKRSQLGNWLESVAHTFEDIAHERAMLMDRLRTIAAMSTLEAG